jgi:bifunctional N-acetylglucosamine-1-phosphate-uridyltransferase/glucosamine-1-phosphate-acetyltransferase GlmU-like protein
VGDAILGRETNLGAGSILSNLKLTGEEIVIEIKGKRYQTGMRKFGGVVGDGTQIGCNAVLNPGCLLGRNCIVYPCASVRGWYAPGSVVRLVQELKVKS